MDILKLTDLTVGPIMFTFLLGFITLTLMLWYTYRKQSYWRNIGIPSAKAWPIFGSVYENLYKPGNIIEQERLQKYGKLYGHYEGNRALISVADPELIRNILVKDFHAFTSRRDLVKTGDTITENMVSVLQGEDWKRVRTIITPTFTTGKIKRMTSIFKECAQTVVQNFRKAAEKGKPIETKTIFGAYTMDVIASSAFSTKIDSHNDPNNVFIKHARRIFVKGFSWRLFIFFTMPFLMKIFKFGIFPKRDLDFFTEVIQKIMEERNKTGKKRNDFLQLLMDTAKEVSDGSDLNEKDDILENYGKDNMSEVFKPPSHSKKTLSQDELIAQCVIFFLAGYDTTGSTLSFVSYVLAMNPDVQEKLIRELDDVLKENNGDLTYEALQSMKYLDNVISETLRLYPPAIRLERLVEEDYKLGDTGLTLHKGMVVSVPICGMHRNPDIFPDPEKFDPDRFRPDERGKRDPYDYMPFGAGPRNCIGMRFALVEIKVCVAYVLSNFRFKRCPQTKVPLEFHLGQSVLEAKDITVAVEIRKDAVKGL